MPHKCGGGCTAGWQASRKCHCSLCGENFSTPQNFDKHQDRQCEVIRCLMPDSVGLTRNARGVWVQQGEVDFDARFKR